MATFSHQALNDEIVADPESLGYKTGGVWKSDQAIADLINDPALGAVITRKLIEPVEIKASIDLGEWEVLSQAKREYLACLLTGGKNVIDANEQPIFDALTSIFGAGSATRTALLAKIQRQGSRAEVLWGENTTVTPGDVGRAANL